jgi:hypothetical protein
MLRLLTVLDLVCYFFLRAYGIFCNALPYVLGKCSIQSFFSKMRMNNVVMQIY